MGIPNKINLEPIPEPEFEGVIENTTIECAVCGGVGCESCGYEGVVLTQVMTILFEKGPSTDTNLENWRP